jgi:hypothetical protein
MLTEDSGPTGKTNDAMNTARYFGRQLARNVAVGMTIQELEVFDAAFEHEEEQSAKQWLA